MAIDLLHGKSSNIASPNNMQTQSASTNAVVSNQAVRQMLSKLSGLSVGDTLIGTLVNKDGNTLQLLLSDNTLLNTILDKDVNLGMGAQISFEVRNNQNGLLTLRPMFTNLANSTTIMDALGAASVDASDKTIEMVDLLMKNSMPIDKATLQTINRELNLFPDADVKDIVMLHKMGIPVNESSVNQMHMYHGNNQWMLDNVASSADELTGMLTDMISKGDENVGKLLDGLNSMLLPEEASDAQTANEGVGLAGELTGAANAEAMDEVLFTKDASAVHEDESVAGEGQVAKEVTNSQSQVNGEENQITENKTQAKTLPEINKFNVFEKLATLEKEKLELPETKEMVKAAVRELLKDNFLMKPKDIAKDNYVRDYYDRTSALANDFSKLLTDTGKQSSDFAKSMNNVKEGTTFMNQINELYNYVQLPLKMNDNHANGDLYVYTRKNRKGGGEDGKLTALLHLSMEHLGNMDIYLTLMEGQKLTTKFTLEKEEMIDFIESHIEELNARLMKKGYNVGTSVVAKSDDSSNTVEKITGKNSEHIILSTQSFDARA